MDKKLDDIRRAVDARDWIDEPAAMAPYLKEWRGLFPGHAAAVVCPRNTAQVAAVVGACSRGRIGVVPQGGNTGLCGGAAPRSAAREIILSLGRLNRIRGVDPLNNTLTVEAGCVLANIQRAAAEAGRLFPLSLASEGSCQIGGNVATNAGGTNVLRYGNTRDLVLGLEAVLPDGRIWDGLRGLRKDNSGYDLKQLFIGSEGTLGVVTAAVLKLFPRPRDVQTALVALPDPDAAVTLLSRLREGAGDAVSGLELMSRMAVEVAVRHVPRCADPFDTPHPWYLLVELSGFDAGDGLRQILERVLAAAFEDGCALDAILADSQARAASLWHLRESIPEGQTKEGASIKHDVSVPVSRVPEFIGLATQRVRDALPGIRPCPFGHVGDGNIHFNLTQPVGAAADQFLARWGEFNRMVHDLVLDLGGSIAAEHGIGQLKTGELLRYRAGTDLDMMRAIKSALDPLGLMNPGKVVPGPLPALGASAADTVDSS